LGAFVAIGHRGGQGRGGLNAGDGTTGAMPEPRVGWWVETERWGVREKGVKVEERHGERSRWPTEAEEP
jgi:hypothetical protein